MVPIRYNVRSLLVRKLTTLATAGGIALVVFVFAASLMLAEGVKRAIAVGGRAENAIVLRKGSDNELASGYAHTHLNLFRTHPQVKQVIGELVLVITAEKADRSGGISNLLIRGMPAEGYAFRPEFKIVSGRAPKPGSNEVVIGRGVTGKFLDPTTNKVIEPGASFDLKRNRGLDVVGVFSSEGSGYEAEVWGDIDVIRKYMGRESIVSSARVQLAAAGDFDAYKDLLERDPQYSVKVMRERDYYEIQSEQTSSFLTSMGFAIAFLFAVAAMIGAAITMNAAVANRSREIGTLRALGFSRRAILFSFILEAIFLAAIGGAIGSVLVLALSFVEFPIINFATFSEMVISFTATPAVFINALIFSTVMGLLGGLVPAIRAARVSPVEAMRA